MHIPEITCNCLESKKVESGKTLKKHSTRVWKYLLCTLFGRINVVEMAILSERFCGFNTTPIKILALAADLEQF